MCAIAGLFYWPTLSRDAVAAASVEMARAMAHRGPDGEGAWLAPDAPVAFAHRRLSIIDLSPAGDQPMTSADGRWTICYNGEIYNHAEMRARLSESGVSWRGHSDTEILLESIAALGLDQTLALAEGMFAFALWDARDKCLILVRDRVGVKPLNAGLIALWRQQAAIGWRARILACVMVALSPHFFGIARLGWYDTPLLNRVQVYAVRTDGTNVLMPSSFFRTHSFAFVSNLDWSHQPLAPTETWGTTDDDPTRKVAERCALPEQTAVDAEALVHPALKDFIRQTHADRRLEGVKRAAQGVFLYPHHVVGDRLAYRDFERLRLDDIAAYVIRVQVVCTDRDAPRVLRDIELTPIAVQPAAQTP